MIVFGNFSLKCKSNSRRIFTAILLFFVNCGSLIYCLGGVQDNNRKAIYKFSCMSCGINLQCGVGYNVAKIGSNIGVDILAYGGLGFNVANFSHASSKQVVLVDGDVFGKMDGKLISGYICTSAQVDMYKKFSIGPVIGFKFDSLKFANDGGVYPISLANFVVGLETRMRISKILRLVLAYQWETRMKHKNAMKNRYLDRVKYGNHNVMVGLSLIYKRKKLVVFFDALPFSINVRNSCLDNNRVVDDIIHEECLRIAKSDARLGGTQLLNELYDDLTMQHSK